MNPDVDLLLKDDAALLRFIEEAERAPVPPPRDLTAGILARVATERLAMETERLKRRRFLALACLSGAACVMLMAGLGVFQDMGRIISGPLDQVTQFIGALFQG